jgi:hypothetical protein
MSSVTRFLKQIPTDSQYFVSLAGSTALNLQYFTSDAAASTTSYVSGAAAGYFTRSNVTPIVTIADGSGSTTLFRDMGKTILSSGRTFRRVQLLVLDGNKTTGVGGGSGWTSTTSGTPGVWQASNEGVVGTASASSLVDSSFGNFYFETGARGLGIAQGLVRYG